MSNLFSSIGNALLSLFNKLTGRSDISYARLDTDVADDEKNVTSTADNAPVRIADTSFVTSINTVALPEEKYLPSGTINCSRAQELYLKYKPIAEPAPVNKIAIVDKESIKSANKIAVDSNVLYDYNRTRSPRNSYGFAWGGRGSQPSGHINYSRA